MKKEEMESVENGNYNRVSVMHEVIKRLRYDNLNDGHCFMIFDSDLPENQAYYEYPDGRIQVEQLNETNLDVPQIVIRALTPQETAAVKEKREVFH